MEIGKFTEKTMQVFRECELVQTYYNMERLYSTTYTFKPVLMKIFNKNFQCFFYISIFKSYRNHQKKVSSMSETCLKLFWKLFVHGAIWRPSLHYTYCCKGIYFVPGFISVNQCELTRGNFFVILLQSLNYSFLFF